MGGMGESSLLPKGKSLLSTFEHLFPSFPLSPFFPVVLLPLVWGSEAQGHAPGHVGQLQPSWVWGWVR